MPSIKYKQRSSDDTMCTKTQNSHNNNEILKLSSEVPTITVSVGGVEAPSGGPEGASGTDQPEGYPRTERGSKTADSEARGETDITGSAGINGRPRIHYSHLATLSKTRFA